MTGKLYVGNLPASATGSALEAKLNMTQYDDVVISVSRVRLKQIA